MIRSENTINKLGDCIDKIGGIDKFSKTLNMQKKTVQKWLRKSDSIPIEALQLATHVLNQNLWEILDGERIRGLLAKGRKSIKVNREIPVEEALIIGWILSEGHLENERVSISQYNLPVLKRLKEIISKTYDFNPSFMSISPDKDGFKLSINSAAFSQYVNLRFGIPIGAKAKIVKISENIIDSNNKETKIALLAGLLEGDGCVSFFIRKLKNGTIFKSPRITFNTYSASMSLQTLSLLESLSYHPKSYLDEKTGENKVNIFKIDECCRFFFETSPYFIHPEFIENFIKLLSQSKILDIILVEGTKIIKIAHTNFVTYRTLADFISKSGYSISLYSVKNWVYGYFRPPLSTVINICDYLKLDYFDFVPEWLAGVLWIQNKVRKRNFERKRKLKIVCR